MLLNADLDGLRSASDTSVAALMEANRRFKSEQLKTFAGEHMTTRPQRNSRATEASNDGHGIASADGGSCAEETVAAATLGLAGIDHHLEGMRAAQMAAIEEMGTEIAKQMQDALTHVMSLEPSHKEDMALIEATDK